MNILIADKFEERGQDALRGLGCNLVYEPGLQGAALADAVEGTACSVLVVRSTKVTEDVLARGEALNVVIRAGAGYNTIDVQAAARRSIFVANCPGKNAVAVAELTFALILGLDRRVVENVNDLRAGSWNKKEYAKARGLAGRTLGILGMGRIGREVARRAQAFGMDVVAWSRSLTAERAEAWHVAQCGSPGDVARACDVLSIHLASTPETKNLVDAEVLARLKPGAYVINTARADVLDYAALAKATKDKHLRVGLDVFPNEPGGGEGMFKSGVMNAGGLVYGTHHIGASTDQAQKAIADETIRIITTYLHTGRVENCVNLREPTPSRLVLVLRHRNKPGVLAHALQVIRSAGINVADMQNVIFDGGDGACAQIRLDSPPSDEVLASIRAGNEHVLGASLFSP